MVGSPDGRGNRARTIVAGSLILAGALSGLGTAPRPAGEASPANAAAVRVQARDVAPDFALAAPDGSRHRLSDLRGKKNVVLVFFRGTW